MLVIAFWSVGAAIVVMILMLVAVSIARNLDGTSRAARIRNEGKFAEIAAHASAVVNRQNASGSPSPVTEQMKKAFSSLRTDSDRSIASALDDADAQRRARKKAFTAIAIIVGVLMAIAGALTDG